MINFIKSFLEKKRNNTLDYNSYLKPFADGDIEKLINTPAFQAICDQVVSNSLSKILTEDDEKIILTHVTEAKTIMKMQIMLKNNLITQEDVNQEETE